jgi:hypothetical protein
MSTPNQVRGSFGCRSFLQLIAIRPCADLSAAVLFRILDATLNAAMARPTALLAFVGFFFFFVMFLLLYTKRPGDPIEASPGLVSHPT